MKKKITLLVMLGLAVVFAVCFAACSKGNEYTVNCLDSENGYVIVTKTSVKAGEKVIIAAHPDAGYQLAGFVVNGEPLEGCSFIMPDNDVTVSARFEAVTYTITYVLGDSTIAGSNPATYTVENYPELIQPESDGYEICGWYRYFDETFDDFYWDIEDYRVASLEGMVGNLTLYAKHYNPLHDINWDSDFRGSCEVENGYTGGRYGEVFNVIVEPARGYELDCIYVNDTPIDGTSFIMPPCDVL